MGKDRIRTNLMQNIHSFTVVFWSKHHSANFSVILCWNKLTCYHSNIRLKPYIVMRNDLLERGKNGNHLLQPRIGVLITQHGNSRNINLVKHLCWTLEILSEYNIHSGDCSLYEFRKAVKARSELSFFDTLLLGSCGFRTNKGRGW